MARHSHLMKYRPARSSRGTSLLEVMMAIVILTFGLLGLAALQSKAHTAELESYQRGQALVLMRDIVSRIENNAANVASYVTASNSSLGTGTTDASVCADEATLAERDRCEWSKALKGSAEKKAGASVGGMLDGRGCIEPTANLREYKVSIVWKGMSEGADQSAWVSCGSGSYTPTLSRRAVTTTLQIPDLAAP